MKARQRQQPAEGGRGRREEEDGDQQLPERESDAGGLGVRIRHAKPAHRLLGAGEVEQLADPRDEKDPGQQQPGEHDEHLHGDSPKQSSQPTRRTDLDGSAKKSTKRPGTHSRVGCGAPTRSAPI
jgi:hypothetical protein